MSLLVLLLLPFGKSGVFYQFFFVLLILRALERSLKFFRNEAKKWDKFSSKHLSYDIVNIISNRLDCHLRYMVSMAASTLDIPAKISLASAINIFLNICLGSWYIVYKRI